MVLTASVPKWATVLSSSRRFRMGIRSSHPGGDGLSSWYTSKNRPDVADAAHLYGGPMASVKQVQVTFDCAEPERVARFWCEVLGYVVPPPPEGFATWEDFDRSLPPERQGSAFACVDPTGVGPRLFFQRVPEGKVVKNRLHLDVRAGTGLVGEERLAALEAECARLVALGADTRAAAAGRWLQRVVPRHAGRRGQRVLPRLRGLAQCVIDEITRPGPGRPRLLRF